jgi:hypothetical protein
MTRRKKLSIGCIAVALALAVAAGAAVMLRPPSLERKLEQVRVGMTYAEVVAIMGHVDGISTGPPFSVIWGSRRGVRRGGFRRRRHGD